MRDRLVELIRSAATDLPADAESALKKARRRESGLAREALDTILENARLARARGRPICQDTGTPIFYVTAPVGSDLARMREEIVEAVREATLSVPLRPNAVDPFSGRNSGDNTGAGFPVVHFGQWGKRKIRFELMLKGGGSENVTQLYRLPDTSIGAGRDIKGVRRCVLDALFKAQGKGCPPYVVGVGVGGLADDAVSLSKRQLMRPIGDANEDALLRRLERCLLKDINALGIGPMGFGGKTTALAVKVAGHHRNPPSYFVAVSFMCAACRRRAVEVKL